MSPQDFDKHMSRLVSCFGSNNYPEERIKLFWGELHSFGEPTWKHLVNTFIAEHRKPPLVPELKEQISILRAKSYLRERNQHAKDAKDFWESKDQPEDVAYKMGVIKRRIIGKCDDREWAGFMELIQNVARSA